MNRRRASITLLAAFVASFLLLAAPGVAQVVPTPTSSTTTTTASTTTTSTTTTTTASTTTTTSGGILDRPSTTTSTSTTTTTAVPGTPPPGGDTPPADDPNGEGDVDGEGATDEDGSEPASTPRTIPSEAQAIINAYPRTGPSNNAALLAGIEELVALGLTRDEAIRVGFGRFPIGGAANYSHDWLYPRWGPGFRFHLGTDVFATYGTPLRSPVEGTVESGNGSLGGLYVKIYMADGTYFYYAHLAGLVEGFEEGMTVRTGDVVGYVGDSGNARGGKPHLHIGIYPQGGGAVDPKPILDQFLRDALDQLPQVVDAVREQRAVTGPAAAPTSFAAPPDPMLETTLLRSFTTRTVVAALPTEDLYAAVANPAAGAQSFVAAEAAQAAAEIDWDAREADGVRSSAVRNRAFALAQVALEPFGLDADQTKVLSLAGG